MVNIQFLIVSYFIGLSVDWIIQHQFQAVNKSKWGKNDNKITSLLANITHSFIYAIMTSIITLLLINKISDIALVACVLFVTHAIIDTRIPVKYILRLKGMTWDQIYDYQTYGFMHIGIDHRLHEIVLLVLAIIIK